VGATVVPAHTHSAAAAVLAHRDAHPWCGSRIDFGPILERIKASRTA